MSERNEEVARRCLAASLDGDMDAVAGTLADDVEMDMRAIPDGTLCRGPDEVIAYLRRHREAWREISIEITAVESRDDRVVVEFVEHATGQASGLEVQDASADLFEFREGLISRVTFYDDPAEARRALEAEHADPD